MFKAKALFFIASLFLVPDVLAQVELHPQSSKSLSTRESHGSGNPMQHGFILDDSGNFALHLVAGGHHSRQVAVLGQLEFEDPRAQKTYLLARSTAEESYFVLQAQDLDLPSLLEGMTLRGHIIQSEIGNYEPENRIVVGALFRIDEVLENILNPFLRNK